MLFLKKTKALCFLSLVIVCAGFSSFTEIKGGEGFEIYLNKRLVLSQYGNEMKEAKSIELDPSSMNSQLSVKYYHCGRLAKDRVITIKDENNNLLKQWKFANETTSPSLMNCQVKEIFTLKKGDAKSLKLYYSSSELPAGRLLTSIVVSKEKIAKL